MHHPFRSGLDEIQREKIHVLAPVVPFVPRLLLANLWIAEPAVVRLLETQPDAAARLHTTIAPTMLAAGVKDNVLPPTARATINFRLHPRDTHRRRGGACARRHRRSQGRYQCADAKRRRKPPKSPTSMARPTNSSHARSRQSFGGIPVAPDMMTGATNSRHYLPIADEVFRLDPFHFGPDDLGRMHGTNERLAVGDLAPAVAFYMRLMKDTK